MSIKVLSFVKFHKTFQANHILRVGIAVSYHLFGLFKGQFFMKLFSTCKQILWGDKSLVFLINILENSLNVLSRIVLVWLMSHQLYELFETNFTSIISIEY